MIPVRCVAVVCGV